MSTIGVVTNPTAGSGRGARWGSQALAALAGEGIRLRDLSRGSWAASLEAALAHRDDIDALVVIGGDGMVHLGLQVCAEHDLPLGVVAAGSGNDIATAWGLPVHDIAAAVASIVGGLQGDVTRVDVGKVTGAGLEEPASPRYVGAVLSAGIDAAVAALAGRLRFPRGHTKYLVATAREVQRYRPYGVSLTIDGHTWQQQCTLVAVANGRAFGGGLIVSPESRVDDGMLEVLITEPLNRREIAGLFPKLYRGTHIHDARVKVIPARTITIAPGDEGARLPVAFADGELVGRVPMTMESADAAVTVLGASLSS